MSTASVVGYCLVAFFVGYCAGSVQRIARRAIEILD